MEGRVHYGYWDMPIATDPKAPMDAKTGQTLISEFILFTAKGVEQNQFKPVFEEMVKKIIPKHNIFVSIEKKKFQPNSMRGLQLKLLPKKDWEDVNFGFHPIIYTNGFGLNEYTVKISGSPDTVHPGTGKPK